MFFAICKRSDVDLPVQNGLAYTPSKMLELAKQGIPISAQAISDDHFFEGDTDYSPHVDIQYQRGIDINDLWNEQQRIHSKMIDATKRAVDLQKTMQIVES